MDCLILQIRILAPCCAAVSRFEKPAGQVVPVRTHVQHAGVARVNDDVIDEESRFAEVIKKLPLLAGIGRRVNLAVERSEIETVGILGIDNEGTNVTALRAGGAPVV